MNPLTHNWEALSKPLGQTIKVTATASSMTKMTMSSKNLEIIEHTWKVLENRVGGLTPMSGNRVIITIEIT